jgi:septum formation protein
MNLRPIGNDYPLILASASPRRKRLLGQIGIPFRSHPSRISETRAGTGPEDAARILSERKAVEVHQRKRDRWILGADTMVVVEGKVLGKPENARDAKGMLLKLAGRAHRVITGFCLLAPSGERLHLQSVSTDVQVKPLTKAEIDAYITTEEPFGKAGAYAIQGIGAFMVEEIRGSYTNVVGLPLCEVVKAMLDVGALSRFPLPIAAS